MNQRLGGWANITTYKPGIFAMTASIAVADFSTLRAGDYTTAILSPLLLFVLARHSCCNSRREQGEVSHRCHETTTTER